MTMLETLALAEMDQHRMHALEMGYIGRWPQALPITQSDAGMEMDWVDLPSDGASK